MSRKKKKRQASAAEVYALCITVGLIVGLGLAPMMDNVLLTTAIGGIGGALAAFLINRKSPRQQQRRHHH